MEEAVEAIRRIVGGERREEVEEKSEFQLPYALTGPTLGPQDTTPPYLSVLEDDLGDVRRRAERVRAAREEAEAKARTRVSLARKRMEKARRRVRGGNSGKRVLVVHDSIRLSRLRSQFEADERERRAKAVARRRYHGSSHGGGARERGGGGGTFVTERAASRSWSALSTPGGIGLETKLELLRRARKEHDRRRRAWGGGGGVGRVVEETLRSVSRASGMGRDAVMVRSMSAMAARRSPSRLSPLPNRRGGSLRGGGERVETAFERRLKRLEEEFPSLNVRVLAERGGEGAIAEVVAYLDADPARDMEGSAVERHALEVLEVLESEEASRLGIEKACATGALLRREREGLESRVADALFRTSDRLFDGGVDRIVVSAEERKRRQVPFERGQLDALFLLPPPR